MSIVSLGSRARSCGIENCCRPPVPCLQQGVLWLRTGLRFDCGVSKTSEARRLPCRWTFFGRGDVTLVTLPLFVGAAIVCFFKRHDINHTSFYALAPAAVDTGPSPASSPYRLRPPPRPLSRLLHQLPARFVPPGSRLHENTPGDRRRLSPSAATPNWLHHQSAPRFGIQGRPN
jgi:hypothetical protein